MGLGSYFLFINATPWPFFGSNPQAHQMAAWEWPSPISPGLAVRVYMEENTGGDSSDAGSITYSLNKTNKAFSILYDAQSNDDPLLTVKTINFNTTGNKGTIPLNWQHNRVAPFILTSSDTDIKTASFVSNNPPINWMTVSYERIKCLTLRELAMPGTHDSGMSEFNQGTGAAIAGNTVTQSQSIAGQLQWGARLFDIRPMRAGGHWATGHYSWSCVLGLDCRWRGGNGQSIASIIAQVNAFTAVPAKSELIILQLGGGLNTDDFDGDEYNHLTQANWNEIMTLFQSVNHLVKGVAASTDLTKLNVSSLFGPTKGAAVLVVVGDNIKDNNLKSKTPVDISAFIGKGIFNQTNFPLAGRYADKDKPDEVTTDQLTKLAEARTSPTSQMFQLSWTLTMQGIGVANIKGIVGLADEFNHKIYQALWPRLTPKSYPNVLTTDSYPKNGDLTALAMAINYHFARKCPKPLAVTPAETGKQSTDPDAPNVVSTTGTCAAGYSICQVKDPTRLEAPWKGVEAAFPQCYDPKRYVCAQAFLCPIEAPKISGKYACSTPSRKMAEAIACVMDGTC